MTVKELIEELNKYPKNMHVYREDSEWGCDSISQIIIKKDEWIWTGPNHTVEDILVIQ